MSCSPKYTKLLLLIINNLPVIKQNLYDIFIELFKWLSIEEQDIKLLDEMPFNKSKITPLLTKYSQYNCMAIRNANKFKIDISTGEKYLVKKFNED